MNVSGILRLCYIQSFIFQRSDNVAMHVEAPFAPEQTTQYSLPRHDFGRRNLHRRTHLIHYSPPQNHIWVANSFSRAWQFMCVAWLFHLSITSGKIGVCRVSNDLRVFFHNQTFCRVPPRKHSANGRNFGKPALCQATPKIHSAKPRHSAMRR